MALTDSATAVRPGEELDAAAVDSYLKAHLDGLEGTPVITQFPGGASNLTYLVRYPRRDLVLRRPPFGRKVRTAHDMGREYHILSRLRGAYPYSPEALAHCTDTSVVGAEFYVMERLDGIILRSEIPPALSLDAARTRTLCESFVDRLVDLHRVDYQACGLGDLGKPQGYVRRQIEGWTERYRQAMTPDAPDWQAAIHWLQANMPADSGRASIIHNDYRFDNVILDAHDPMRITGVLDWELATLGDPLMDLGSSLAYWVQADDPEPVQRMRRQPSNAPGMLDRRGLVACYAERSGLAVDGFDFYYIYGLFRLAGIVQQIYYRYHHGQTSDRRFAGLVDMNRLLERMGMAAIERSTL